jgi:Reverse transcriptase (RNA-dependent DNA polymerase)
VDEHWKVIVLFFVNDILLLYHLDNADEAQRIVARVKRAYELREMGEAKWFLGIRITRNKELGTLTLTYNTYIEKIAYKFGLTDRSLPSTPLPILELLKNKGQAPPS